MRCAALCDNVARAGFALATLGSDTQFKLDFVKSHAGAHMARNFAVRNTVANADDHGNKRKAGWLEKPSINANSSHY